MHLVKMLSSILLVIGGLNWGLYGILHIDLVNVLFGGLGIIATVVYGLIGLSAILFILEGKLFGTNG